jgi:hypothetical protein
VDGARNTTLLKLIWPTVEQLDEIDRQIVRIKQIVQKKSETVAVLKANGHPMKRAERMLSNLIDLPIAHGAHRAKIVVALQLEGTAALKAS